MMDLEFSLGPLRISARYRPAVPGRRVGHLDRWTEYEPEEIEILSVEGEADVDVTERDLEDAVREEAERTSEGWRDAWIAREEISGW
jgi:hypothetical protein